MTTPDQQLYRLRDVRGRPLTANIKNANGETWIHTMASDDVDLTLDWANDPLAREMSFSQQPIPKSDHQTWFYNRVTEGNWWILEEFIGYGDVVPIGQIRFDKRAGRFEYDGRAHTFPSNMLYEHFIVSIFVAPEWRGRGYGVELLRSGLARVESQRQRLPCVAYIKKENKASIRLFNRAGFGSRFVISGRHYLTVDGDDYITLVRHNGE